MHKDLAPSSKQKKLPEEFNSTSREIVHHRHLLCVRLHTVKLQLEFVTKRNYSRNRNHLIKRILTAVAGRLYHSLNSVLGDQFYQNINRATKGLPGPDGSIILGRKNVDEMNCTSIPLKI